MFTTENVENQEKEKGKINHNNPTTFPSSFLQ